MPRRSGVQGNSSIGRPWIEVRTEQVLLALVAHGDGVAARVLTELGVDLERSAVATTHIRFPQLQQQLSIPAAVWPPELA